MRVCCLGKSDHSILTRVYDKKQDFDAANSIIIASTEISPNGPGKLGAFEKFCNLFIILRFIFVGL